MNNLLLNFAHNRLLLGLVGIVGLLLLVLAAARAIRRDRRAIWFGLTALPFFALSLAVVIKFPFAILGESENLERLSGVELTAAPPQSDDWPQWRGPNRDGLGRAPGLRLDWTNNPPFVVWKMPLGSGYSSFAVVGDALYTQDLRNGMERVVCLDDATGRERWSYEYPVDYSGFQMGYAKGPRGTPTVHDGRVYTVGATGKFLCLEANPAGGKAKLLWQHDLMEKFDARLPVWGVACSPLVEGDLVIVQPGGRKGTVAAFKRSSGDLAWAALSEDTGYSSPVAATLAGVRQIVAFTGSRLVGLKPGDGAELWSSDFPTQYNANIATPLIAGDTVFISSSYGSGCALLKIVADGGGLKVEQVFRYPGNKHVMGTHHMTCVLRDGHIYGCDDMRGDLKCIDLRRPREPKWETQRVGKSSLILAEGHLIVLSQDGSLWLIDATPAEYCLKGDMKNLLNGSDCWALPALSRGRLYLRDHEHAVCLKVGD